MLAYYNENDPFAVAWLRELIARELIPFGYVDDRDIREVESEDLEGYAQHHFFAGIGGWPQALRLAGWPDDRSVWTGSLPCQPFSISGRQQGVFDNRHLWPSWFSLIRKRRPPVIFGEQVASAAGLLWLDLVSADLEKAGYAFGAVDLCAASVGAPHIRQRLYFVADNTEPRRARRWAGKESEGPQQFGRSCLACVVGNNNNARLEGRNISRNCAYKQLVGAAGLVSGFWEDAEWIPCTDGKYRPIEPGTFPLAHGVPARVGRLRGYGNAIVPPLAQTFIEAYLDGTR